MGQSRPSRRTFLGGAALALAACGSEPVRRASSSGPSSSTARSTKAPTKSGSKSASLSVEGTLVRGSFASKKRAGADTSWAICYPPGTKPGDPLPVLVALHGRAGGWYSVFHEMHVDRFVAEAVRGGMQPFAIAAVDGGVNRYWHPRHPDDPAGMVVDEFLPLLAEHKLRTKQVALYGWSMGGVGALYIASLLGRSRVACVGAEGPSVFEDYADREPGSYDSPADFAAHSIFTRVNRLQGIPIRIDLGARDRFGASVAKLRDEIQPRPVGDTVPGVGHLVSLWLQKLPDQVRFIGEHLAG
jgi:enterochelin esterase-like enzyme